jgi:hypothetical protein
MLTSLFATIEIVDTFLMLLLLLLLLLPAFHHGVLGSSPTQNTWDLWWTKWQCNRFSASTYISPANHSTECSTLIIIHHLGLCDMPSGLSPSPPQESKKNHFLLQEY